MSRLPCLLSTFLFGGGHGPTGDASFARLASSPPPPPPPPRARSQGTVPMAVGLAVVILIPGGPLRARPPALAHTGGACCAAPGQLTQPPPRPPSPPPSSLLPAHRLHLHHRRAPHTPRAPCSRTRAWGGLGAPAALRRNCCQPAAPPPVTIPQPRCRARSARCTWWGTWCRCGATAAVLPGGWVRAPSGLWLSGRPHLTHTHTLARAPQVTIHARPSPCPRTGR